MGSLILTMHTSADGFVATEKGEMWQGFGWPPEAQALLNQQYERATAVVYGRGIYQMVVPFWLKVASEGVPTGSPLGPIDVAFAKLMAPLPKYVVTRGFTPGEPDTKVISRDVVAEVTKLKAAGDVLLLAGGALAGELATAGVLDELFLLVGPVAMGRGKPLLDVDAPVPTPLISAQSLAPKCTVMRYRVAREFPTER